ncbi:MAG TPA: peptidoglycan DD-metalloendopeptidase family protein [Sphingobacteriaceae bacterium]|nr:peptidoglycan DD-metalloendopeptidase family protein [Sphingobacteriaceae bacterium]
MAGSGGPKVRTWRDDYQGTPRPGRPRTLYRPAPWRRVLEQRFARQVLGALLAGLLVWAGAALPWGLGDRVRSGARWVVDHDVDLSRFQEAAQALWRRWSAGVAGVRSMLRERLTDSALPAGGSALEDDQGPGEWAWPVQGEVIRSFGWQPAGTDGLEERRFFPGIEIAAVAGEPVRAAAAGRVYSVEYLGEDGGWLVAVEHGGGWVSRYGGCDVAYVQPGDQVYQGQMIAALAPGADGLHKLYLELELDGLPVDPEPKLRRTMEGF